MCLRDEQRETFGCSPSGSGGQGVLLKQAEGHLSVTGTALLRMLLGLLMTLSLRPGILSVVLQPPYLRTHTASSAPSMTLGMQVPCFLPSAGLLRPFCLFAHGSLRSSQLPGILVPAKHPSSKVLKHPTSIA